jgi:hypothetical protein
VKDRHETEHRSFGTPDETREFPHGHAEPAVVVDWYGASNYAKGS